jgi:hypothetical protein
MATDNQLRAAVAEEQRRHSRPEAAAARGWVDTILREQEEINSMKFYALNSSIETISDANNALIERVDDLNEKLEDLYVQVDTNANKANENDQNAISHHMENKREFKEFRIAVGKQIAILKNNRGTILQAPQFDESSSESSSSESSGSESSGSDGSGRSGSTADSWEIEEIRRLQNARQNAMGKSRRKHNRHKKSHKKSHKKGHNKGHKKSHTKSHKKSHTKSHKKSHKKGYKKGHKHYK